MEWVEMTGRTVEEAKEAALDVLGVDFSEAVFEILEEPRTGFLGLSKKQARVRARVKPTTPRAKELRRDTRRRGSKGSSDGSPKPDKELVEAKESASGEVSAKHASTSARPARGGARERSRSERPKKAVKAIAEKGTEEQTVSTTEEGPSRIELAGAAQHFLAGLLGEMGLAGTVHVDHVDDESMELSILGDDLGVLIGSKGHVVSAVQELTRAIVQRAAGEGSGRVTVDVAGYRAKRVRALERFVTAVATEVLETGVEKALEPMVSADRKIVHDTAANIEGIGTRSEGYDPRRYVVLYRYDAESEQD